MPKFKKSSGFKMKGYSYPGKSPVKRLDDPSSGDQSHAMDSIESDVDEIEGLTDEQKADMLEAVAGDFDDIADAAEKRRRGHLAKMDFKYQRSKFSGGDIPIAPSGLPS